MCIRDSNKILLIDDYHIDECTGLHRVIHPGIKAEHPVLTADQPWEAINQMGGTVRKENSSYRMWYDSWVCNAKHNGYSSLYAESDDGINWVKPNLKKYKDFNGNINNNIYLNRISLRENTISPPINVEQDHNKNILYTPHLGTGKTYTMLAYDYARTAYGPYDGYYLAYSDDGINWTDGPLEPVIPGHADVGWFMYDERHKMFRGIVKQYLNIRGYSRRSVLWTESKKGELIKLTCYKNGKDEAIGISDEIEKLKKKYSLNDISILVRAIFQTREFEERFLKIGIPYRIIGGIKFYERAEIKDCIAYLRVVNQNKDDLSFERIINTPKRSIGETTVKPVSYTHLTLPTSDLV